MEELNFKCECYKFENLSNEIVIVEIIDCDGNYKNLEIEPNNSIYIKISGGLSYNGPEILKINGPLDDTECQQIT